MDEGKGVDGEVVKEVDGLVLSFAVGKLSLEPVKLKAMLTQGTRPQTLVELGQI